MILLALLLLLTPPAAASWSWPADGPVVRPFTYDARAPFARGARRGIVIGAPRGATVRSACEGRAGFAGTAGANGRAVTVLCGRYATTYLGLSSIGVRSGAAVRRGERLGRAGREGLRFGVRRTAGRWAYVDPLRLLPARREPGGAPILGRAPRGEPLRPLAPRLAAPLRSPTGIPLGSPPRAARRARAPAPEPSLPLVAWAGLFATACGLVGAPLIHLRRRRSAAAATLRPTWIRR